MSAIDELCQKLADRGEPYIRNFGDMVTWLYYSDPHSAVEAMDGTLQVTGLTPEQVIAATLGPGTCHRKPHINLTIGDKFLEQSGWDCSECGCRLDLPVIARYCPNCGRRVVDE